MFITNLASIGLPAVNHHIYNFGTCSQFVSIGSVERTAQAGPQGEYGHDQGAEGGDPDDGVAPVGQEHQQGQPHKDADQRYDFHGDPLSRRQDVQGLPALCSPAGGIGPGAVEAYYIRRGTPCQCGAGRFCAGKGAPGRDCKRHRTGIK